MTTGTIQGGGHIDTPYPEKSVLRRPSEHHLDTPSTSDTTVETTAQPRIWLVKQRINPYFNGRERLLQQLHNRLQKHSICHIRGVSGSGTTQTALAYVYRARASFDAVLWIDAREGLLLRLELSQMADELDRMSHDEVRQGELLSSVTKWLATDRRWLLVADGLSDIDALVALLPESHRGRVLITGEKHLEYPDLETLDHGPLNPDNARNFLEHRAGQHDAPGVVDFVALFEGCTLSLSLAGAYCHTTSTPLEQYHRRISENLEGPQAKSSHSLMHKVIHATVDQSLRYVSNQDPAALELMALCSFLAPVGIPLVTLYDGSPFLPKRLSACVTTPKSLNRALTLLFHLGLIQFEDNGLCIHTHIQEATRRLLGKEQEAAWLRTALRVVLEAFPVESEYLHPIPACSMLVRHALVVSSLAESAGQYPETTGALLNQIGLYLHACEELDRARNCFERALSLAQKAYGTSIHPTVAARTNSLGVVLQDMGLYAEARDCYRRTIELCEMVFGKARDAAMGPAHRSMLTMPSRNLCQVLEAMGDIVAAKAAYESAIETFMEVYCWNHPLVAETFNGLGQLLHRAGENGPAQQCFHKAIQSEENAEEPVLGALALYTRNLAHCLLEDDKVGEAIKNYELSLAFDREDFGAVHETVALDLLGLARSYRAVSLFAEAHECLDEALEIWEALDGDSRIQQAITWRQKGRCHLDADDDVEAIEALQKALSITELVAGPDSPLLGPDLVYLGRAYGRLEDFSASEACLLRAITLHENSPWLDEEGLATCYSRLVRVYRALQNYPRAVYYQECALQDHQRRFGAMSDRVGADAYSLGNLYIAVNDLESAIRYLRMAVDIYEESRGLEDERTTRVRRKLETAEVAVRTRTPRPSST